MKFKFLLVIVIIVNATGLFSGILEPDGALYAYIAKQMAQHNDFINLYNNSDWLDKPHFPFWITAISFKIFGINSFAYKLPAFIFWLGSLYYLYKTGKEFYNRQTARVAVLIYATAFQSVIALFDVRAEHYLTALTIAAIYYLYKLYSTNAFKYVVLASIFSACAVMTKGIFFLTTIVSGLGLLILIKKDWRQFANYKWYLYLLLTFIFIIPELYCLYVQFDLHPEKIIFGKTNVSGLRFFFWDSQFGRFFNTGPIKGKGDLFFFFHTILWAFLPWSILLYAAVIRLISKKSVLYNSSQWIIIGSLGITFLIFSLSKFQLPHYLIVLFPHCALICADYLLKRQGKHIQSFIIIQGILLVVGLLILQAVAVIFGLPLYGWIIVISLIIAALFLYVSRSKTAFAVLQLGVGFCLIVHLFLNLCFYPALLHYQAGGSAAAWFNRHIKSAQIGLYKTENYSLKFYINSQVIATDTIPGLQSNRPPLQYYFTTKPLAESLMKDGVPITILQTFSNFHVSQLNAAFLNKNTRSSQLDTTVIFELNR